jgi:plastocyanin
LRADEHRSTGVEIGRRMMVAAAGIAVGLIVVLAGRGKGEMASGDVRPGTAGAGAVRLVMEDDRLDVSTAPMNRGDVKTVRFTAPKGTAAFSCTWHKGMVGRVVAA